MSGGGRSTKVGKCLPAFNDLKILLCILAGRSKINCE
jgi:hypothetical protein